MGREVRKVPADWVHPEAKFHGRTGHQPMFDQSFKDAEKEWLADFDRVRAGQMDDIEKECYPNGVCEWASENTPPDPAYYMPDWTDEERTHFMMYEDTSEGTPISPAFETPEELARWLTDNGASTFASYTATYEQWLPICRGGFAPSMVISGGKIMGGVEAMSEIEPQ